MQSEASRASSGIASLELGFFIQGLVMGKQVILEGFIGDVASPSRISLDVFPYTIGRDPTCPLHLNTNRVSRLHAQVEKHHGQLSVTDLNSTNGTFVNRMRIDQRTPLHHGDVVHFAEHEFRVHEMDPLPESGSDVLATMEGLSPLSTHFPTQGKEFSELLSQGLVQGYAQSITDRQGRCVGYELLGRSTHPGLQEGPLTLFTLAHALDEEIALSELLRRQCLAEAHAVNLQGPLLFNTHPRECQEPKRLLAELKRLRRLYPVLPLVCEIHEAAVTDRVLMADLRKGLSELEIGLAYDDFGAGQARLLELVEVPPDVLKFDYALIAGLTGPKASTYRLVETLTKLVKEMGIVTLAEGIETEEVALSCLALGIDQFQGYYYGRPAPITPASGLSESTRPLPMKSQ